MSRRISTPSIIRIEAGDRTSNRLVRARILGFMEVADSEVQLKLHG
jgi:hypothetical protein